MTALNRGGLGPQLKREACGRDWLFRASVCSDLAEEPLGSSWVPEEDFGRDVLGGIREGSDIPSVEQTQGNSPCQMIQPSFGFTNKRQTRTDPR